LRNWSIQLALVSGVIILTVLLFYANRKPPVKTEAATDTNNLSVVIKGLEHFMNDATLALDKNSRTKWEDIKKKSESLSGKEKKNWLDSATAFWDAAKRPDIASVYAAKVAENKPKSVTPKGK